MPTIYKTSNACKQYNEPNNMEEYYVNSTSYPLTKFLTIAPLTRILAENELSALYFLCLPQNVFIRYYYYLNNAFILSIENSILEEELQYHNALPINWIGAPANANKMLIQIFNEGDDAISEIRYFIKQESTCNEKQVTWLNKLGGYDSFMFTGGEEYIINAEKENPIEYPFNTNFESPLRINSYRSINSKKSFTLANQCTTKETADWLKSELVNSSDVYVIENDVYIPVDVQTTNVEYNSWSKQFIVKFGFTYSFPINIQTR
jgi:hypothetical protein